MQTLNVLTLIYVQKNTNAIRVDGGNRSNLPVFAAIVTHSASKRYNLQLSFPGIFMQPKIRNMHGQNHGRFSNSSIDIYRHSESDVSDVKVNNSTRNHVGLEEMHMEANSNLQPQYIENNVVIVQESYNSRYTIELKQLQSQYIESKIVIVKECKRL